MPRLLDKIVVLDLSQTCWPEGQTPPGQQPDIIELGVCLVDVRSGRLERWPRLFVRPERSVPSRYCQERTGVHERDLAEARSFRAVCEALRRELGTRDRIWASFGNHVRRIVKKQCQADGIRYPFGASHINLKSLLAVLQARAHEQSLPEAMQAMNLPVPASRHRANDRAACAAMVLTRLLLEHRMKLVGGTN